MGALRRMRSQREILRDVYEGYSCLFGLHRMSYSYRNESQLNSSEALHQ